MPRNGAGTYTLPAGNPVVTGTVIESSWANTTLADLAAEMTNSLARNGAGGMTAPFRLFDGTVSSPGLAFTLEPSTGLFRKGLGVVGFSVLGVEQLKLDGQGVTISGALTVNDLEVGGKAVVAGDLEVGGKAVVAGDLEVGGKAVVAGDVQAQSFNGGQLAGFRNKIINGNFDVWQRGTTATISTAFGAAYLADRWNTYLGGGLGNSVVTSRQAFTAGQTDVPGEPTFFSRVAYTFVQTSPDSEVVFSQSIEDVRTCAGQTITVSFYAKADGAKDIVVTLSQNFGTDGAASPPVHISFTKCSLTTSWQKFTITVAVPSISGKTIGSNSHLSLSFTGSGGSILTDRWGFSIGEKSITYDIASVQLETGSVATPFENRPLAAEIVLCQRYFETSYPFGTAGGSNFPGTNGTHIPSTSTPNGAYLRTQTPFKVTKRGAPAVTIYPGQNGAAGTLDVASIVRSCTPVDVTATGFGAVQNTSGVTWNAGDGVRWNWHADAEF